MSVTPVGRTDLIPNDPIHARSRKYGLQKNSAIASESGSAVASSTMLYVVSHNMGGKTPSQAAVGLGNGAYSSAQVGYRSV
jgi:hypothetical protein